MTGNVPSAPIPGESLTNPPGTFPWERPPQFTMPEEAVTHIWKTLIKPSKLPKMLALLENGATVADIAKGTLLAGFQEGLWTIDLMMLIDKNVFLMVAALADKAGIKYKMIPEGGPGDVDDFINNLNANLAMAKMDGEQPEDITNSFAAAKQTPGAGGTSQPSMFGGLGAQQPPQGQPPQAAPQPPMPQ